MKRQRLVVYGLTGLLGLSQVITVGAAPTIQSVQQEKDASTASLAALQKQIDELETKKEEITGQIDSLDGQLVTTIADIEDLGDQIDIKEGEIKETGKELKGAEAREETEYNAMKKRIQYIYENGGSAGWAEIFLSGGDITKMLNKAEYTQKMYKYDRECLEEYAATVQQVNDLKTQEEKEKSHLVDLKSDQEENKEYLQKLLDEAKITSKDYDAQLKEADEKAAAYKELIAQQTAMINQLVAEQEAIRRAQEEAAAQAAAQAAAEAAAAEQEQYYSDDGSYESDGSYDESYADGSYNGGSYDDGSSYDDSGDYDESENAGGSGSSGSGSSGSSQTYSSSSGSSNGSASGSAIVDYANQYIGNPYVYGGNSLTNGTDCSGFVNQVYGNNGYSVPRDSTSLRSVGSEVSSLSDAQPGDIICYSGHVAIYTGDGNIVHASTPETGITTGKADYHDILTIRRVVD